MTSDSTKEFYEKYADDFEEKTKERQKENWIESFTKLLPSNGKVLDLGCAYGRDSETFSQKGFEVVGVDFSEAFIAKAKQRVPQAKFIAGDIREVAFGKKEFDGVWASAILLHISKEDTEKVLNNLHDSLQAGGVIFLGMYLGEGEGLVKDNRYEGVEKYYSYFSEEALKGLLQKHGFSIVTSVTRPKDSYERNDVIELIAKKD